MAGAYYLGVLLLQRVVTPTRCYPTYYRWGDISLYFFTLLFSTVYLALRSCTALLPRYPCTPRCSTVHPPLVIMCALCLTTPTPPGQYSPTPPATRHSTPCPLGGHICPNADTPDQGEDRTYNSTVATAQWQQHSGHRAHSTAIPPRKQ